MEKHISLVAVLVAMSIVGCEPSRPAAETNTNASDGSTTRRHTHDRSSDHRRKGHHHGVGPHGGTIVDWGGGTFHVELVVDHTIKKATVYILGDDEKTPSPINAESVDLAITSPQVFMTLIPEPQQDDPPGESSCFVGTHKTLDVAADYQGTLTALIDGTPYSGDFNENLHDGHHH
ncbi:MAG: hypothetical protein AAGJ83_02725 [Planctomycetota bacterium]